MSKPDSGGPAFPCTPDHSVRMNGEGGAGMSLRDYFAAKALPIAAGQFSRFVDDAAPELGVYLSPDGYEHAARAAYSLADAMLVARGDQ